MRLALADRYLAQVRSILEGMGAWNSSVIVIMGDHSWRTRPGWSKQADWTEEERLASHGGQFDDRPLYVVKFADQHTGKQIDFPFKAIDTRRMLDGMLAGRLTTADALAAWAAVAN